MSAGPADVDTSRRGVLPMWTTAELSASGGSIRECGVIQWAAFVHGHHATDLHSGGNSTVLGRQDGSEPQADEEQRRKRESESRRRQEEDNEAFARQCQAELDAEERDGAAAASTDGDEELAQRLASDVGDTQEGSVPPYKAGDKVEGFWEGVGPGGVVHNMWTLATVQRVWHGHAHVNRQAHARVYAHVYAHVYAQVQQQDGGEFMVPLKFHQDRKVW